MTIYTALMPLQVGLTKYQAGEQVPESVVLEANLIEAGVVSVNGQMPMGGCKTCGQD